MANPKTESKGNGVLPTGSARIMHLVEQSQPSSTRPRISEEFEAQLQPVHAKSAACYASMEDIGDQLDRLSHRIDDDESVIVGEMNEDDDSISVRINEVATELRESRVRLAAAAATPRDGTPAIKEEDSTNGVAQPASPRERASTH